jgi:DNA-directed RNA polymerase subunit F
MITNMDHLMSQVDALLDARKYPKVFDDMSDKDNLIVEKAAGKILEIMDKYNLTDYSE